MSPRSAGHGHRCGGDRPEVAEVGAAGQHDVGWALDEAIDFLAVTERR